MRVFTRTYVLVFAFALLAGCGSGRAPGAGDWTVVQPAPLPLTENVLNPGRGFYDGSDVDLWNPDPASYNLVREHGFTLAYADATWLPVGRALTQDDLDSLQAGFDQVRKSGFKLILRFRYSENGDADWDVITADLNLLALLIAKNADVIAVLQAGFLGRWGEWHCWQATGPCHDGAEKKKYVLDVLLSALEGTDVPVAVRYPPDKARYLGELDFPDYDHVPPPPEPVTGFVETAGRRARIAYHNDCFLSNADDVGTYPNEPPERIEQWRNFTYSENAYLVFGGETCEAEDADDPGRSRGARALAEMERAHVDYLNADYHPEMLAGWRQDGVYDEIAARLGYRLVVTEAAWSKAGAGQPWAFRLTLRNDGFSRLKRRYDVVLVLERDGRVVERPLGFDLRTVAAGRTKTFVNDRLAGLEAGRWRLGVAVRDPALPDRAEYAIRFANHLDYDGVNWLGTITVR